MTSDCILPAPGKWDCVILGGGGHARVLIDCLRSAGCPHSLVLLDADRQRWGTSMMGVPIVGGDDRLEDLMGAGAKCFAVGLGATRDNRPRRGIFLRAAASLAPLEVRHPSAIVSPYARLGRGCQLLPGCVVNAGAVLGENVIVNSGAIVEHDCEIGDHAHVATGARLASTVRVSALAHIGVGASVRQCISVGEGAVVGAGSVVVRDVPPWKVVAGVPARPLE